MTSFLFAAAIFILVMAGVGLVRILRGPGDADRILSVQLIGSGGVAVLLLLAVRDTNAIHYGRRANARIARDLRLSCLPPRCLGFLERSPNESNNK